MPDDPQDRAVGDVLLLDGGLFPLRRVFSQKIAAVTDCGPSRSTTMRIVSVGGTLNSPSGRSSSGYAPK